MKLEDAIRAVVREELEKPRTPEEARLSKGLSLEVLAEKVGISSSTISRMERGKCKNPDAPLLKKIAQILDFPAYPILVARRRDNAGGVRR